MPDMTVGDMRAMQRELHKKYGRYWLELTPENGHYSVLWLVGEVGEMIDIIKKQGAESIMSIPETRRAMVDEIVDVQKFLMDVLTCYQISDEEFAKAYRQKHEYNMKRWEE